MMSSKYNYLFKLILMAYIAFKLPSAKALESTGKESTDKMDSELAELLSVLDEETTIATKTRLNSDFVPGMVTILNGADMEAIGMPTAFAALSTVPGIQTSRLSGGEPSLIMRGLQFPFNTGNVKVMVNSLAMSGETSGLNSSVLFMPIQQIDRIEVIRGPGSAIYGDYAFMGLVNITTKKEENQVFALVDNDGNGSAGIQLGYRPVTSDFSWSANLAGFDSGEGTVPADAPSAYQNTMPTPPASDNGMRPPPPTGESQTPNAPPTREINSDIVQKRRFAILQGSYHNTQINGQYFQSKTTELETSEKSSALGIRHHMEISSYLTAEAELSYLYNSFSSGQNAYKGSVIQQDLQLNWLPNRQHNFLFGLKTDQTTIDLGKSRAQFIRQNANVADYNYSGVSLGLQDQLALSEDLNITAGLQYYRRSDLDIDLFSPRLAAVWQAAENHILKVQYAQGFRSPTYFELFNQGIYNSDLDFEINKTTEISYIYRTPYSTVRVTGFVSEIEDMIFVNPQPEGGFSNNSEAKMSGGELELEQQFGSKLTLRGNLSYTDAKGNRNNQQEQRQVSGSARWLSNLSLIFQPLNNNVVSIHWLKVGDRALLQGETDGYDLIDLTYSRFNFLAKGFNLSAGVRNLFDDDLIYFHTAPQANIFRQYPGRTVWIQGDYIF
jgi:outer membrane receptor for ferrienterochelin and colicins